MAASYMTLWTRRGPAGWWGVGPGAVQGRCDACRALCPGAV